MHESTSQHPLQHATTEAVIRHYQECQETGEWRGIDDLNIRKATDFLNYPVTIIDVWELASDYDNSVLILLSVDWHSEDDLLIVRGNAGRIALHLKRIHRLPCIRVLRSVPMENGNSLYYWGKDDQSVSA